MAAASNKYRGVARLRDGRWLAYITNNQRKIYQVGRFDTAELAALAHDRAVLHLLGQAACAACNFRVAFSDTELRFLHSRHAPKRSAGSEGILGMLRTGTYDAEFAQFAACAFDEDIDMDFVEDKMLFRHGNCDILRQRREAATAGVSDPVAQLKAERDTELEVFMEFVKNKAMDEAWVRSYLSTKEGNGQPGDEESSWPKEFASPDVGDDVELIYLTDMRFWVEEMIKF